MGSVKQHEVPSRRMRVCVCVRNREEHNSGCDFRIQPQREKCNPGVILDEVSERVDVCALFKTIHRMYEKQFIRCLLFPSSSAAASPLISTEEF